MLRKSPSTRRWTRLACILAATAVISNAPLGLMPESPVMAETKAKAPGQDAKVNVEFELYGALPYSKGSIPGQDNVVTQRPRDLTLSTSVDQNEWDWVMGMAMDYNRGIHRGRILKGEILSDSITIEMDIKGDPWVKGGRAEYTLTLEPLMGNGERHGTYKGVFRGIPMEGKVLLRISQPLTTAKDHQSPAWDEHPRMLFRKSDLEALKEKAKTPLGQAWVKKMKAWENDPVSLGMLYQLTGEKHYAEKAMAWTDKALGDENVGAFRGAAGDYGKRVAKIAMVFDLCYDAWPERFRQKVIATTAWRMQRMLYNPTGLSRGFNWSFNSNWAGHMNAGAGMAGLFMFDKPDINPMKAPLKLGDVPRVFEGMKELENWPKDSFEPFTSGKMPTNWLFCGPFPNRLEEAFPILEDRGGITKAIPQVGDEVSYEGVTHKFELLGEKGFWNYGKNNLVIEMMGSTNKTFHSTSFFFTAIKVAEKQLVQFNTGAAGAHPQFYLNGTPILAGEPLVLKPGIHTLFARNHFYQINPWGKAWMQPRFTSITTEAAQERLARMHDRYLLDYAEYMENKAYADANNGASARYRWLSMAAFRKTQLFHRYTFGDGGFQTEGETYTSVGSSDPILWESLYKKTFGQASSGRPDVTHFGPRYVAQTIYNNKGIHAHQSFSLSDGSRNAEQWLVIYPATAPEMQGAALWGWNKALGILDGGLGQSARQRGDDADFIAAVTKRLHPVKGFLYYPMDKVPLEPKKELPKVWEARTKGLYVFRNAWNDPQDIVTQVFLKAEGGGGWQNPDAGAIRLWGLGHLWTHRGAKVGGSKTVQRWQESVVQLPDDKTNIQMGAVLLGHEAKPDGSGSVSMDMKYLYMGKIAAPPRKGKKKPAKVKLINNDFKVNHHNLVDLGITGKRLVAVDYSGRSGAPALIAMVDQIEGGGRKLWTWQLPDVKGHKGKVARDQVKFTEDGFIIDRGDANLKVTFVSPTKPKIRFADEPITVNPNNDSAKRKRAKGEKVEVTSSLHCIWVSDAEDEKNGHFFAIVTLQKKDAPTVEVLKGEGLEAEVKVGGAKVSLNQGKIVIE